MNGRSQPTLHPKALHFRGLLCTTKSLWEMWWFELPHSYISVINCTDRAVSAVWSKGWTMPPKAVLWSHLMCSVGRDCEGAVSWPHVSKLCPSDYTVTKKAPAWLLNKQNQTSPTGSTLRQLRSCTALFPGLASVVSKHVFPLPHPGYILGRYWK